MRDKKKYIQPRYVFAPLLALGLAYSLACPSLSWALSFSDQPSDPLSTQNSPQTAKTIALPGTKLILDCAKVAPISGSLSYTQAIITSICNNPVLGATLADIHLQEASVGIAKAGYLPTIQLTGSKQQQDIRYEGGDTPPVTNKTTPIQLSIQQQLLDFGGRSAKTELASSLLRSAISSYEAEINKQLYEVASAYFQVLTSKTIADALGHKVELYAMVIDIAQNREKNGVGNVKNTLQAKSDWEQARLEHHKAKDDFLQNLSVLLGLLGVQAPEELTLAEKSFPVLIDALPPLPAFLTKALAEHPLVTTKRERWMGDKKQVEVTLSDGRPTLDIRGNYYLNGRSDQSSSNPNSKETTVTLTVTVPLFDGFSNDYKIRSANAQAEKSYFEWQLAEKDLTKSITQDYIALRSAIKSKESVNAMGKISKENLLSSLLRYRRGVAGIDEIIKAVNQLADNETEEANANGKWVEAQLKFLTSTGRLWRYLIHKSQ